MFSYFRCCERRTLSLTRLYRTLRSTLCAPLPTTIPLSATAVLQRVHGARKHLPLPRGACQGHRKDPTGNKLMCWDVKKGRSGARLVRTIAVYFCVKRGVIRYLHPTVAGYHILVRYPHRGRCFAQRFSADACHLLRRECIVRFGSVQP